MIKDGQFYIDFPEPYKRRELNAKYREIPLNQVPGDPTEGYDFTTAEEVLQCDG